MSKQYVYLQPETFTIGVSTGDFIEFYWNGVLEESYLPRLLKEGYWVLIGEL
jgi:hypothetical protein